MVWGAISYEGTLTLVEIEGTLAAQYYCDVMKQSLLDDANATLGGVWTFIQNNASVHSANYYVALARRKRSSCVELAHDIPRSHHYRERMANARSYVVHTWQTI